MACTRTTCSPHRPCPLALVAALLFLAALLGACSPGNAPADAAPADAAPEAPAPGAAVAAAAPERLSAAAFVARLGPDDVVVDVRTPEEFASGHLDGALLADVTAPDFEARVASLDRARTTYVYCRTGNRSQRAAEAMRAMGFTRVVNVGGYADLEAAGAAVRVPEG